MPSVLQTDTLESNPGVKPDSLPQQLCYCTEDGNPVLEIAILGDKSLTNYKTRKIDPKSTKINGISPFLQSAPSVLTYTNVANSNYMEVLVNGTLAPSKTEGLLMPMVRGPNGRFIEQAKLRNGKSLSRISGGTAIWAIASTVFAQKHLADISNKLDALTDSINDVRDFLNSERKSIIFGSLAYLKDQAFPAVMSGEFSPSVRSQLEGIERKLLEVQHHLLDELQQLAEKTPSIEHKDYFGTEELFLNIKNHQEKIKATQEQFILCIRTRAASWQILCTFPGDEILKDRRKAIILQSIKSDLNPILLTVEKHMYKKISEISSIWNTQETIDSRKADLRSSLESQQDKTKKQLHQISKDVNTLSDRLSSFQKPVRLAIKMNGEDIIEAYELEGP